MSVEAEFRTTWAANAGRAGVAERWADSLVSRHREPWRRYHTLHHVVWVLRHVRSLHHEAPCDDLATVVMAACFHDAVYDPRADAGANERDSAVLATAALTELGWGDLRTARAARLIEATATHESDGTHDTDVLLAADLAILAAEPSMYADYVRQVRAEYDFVDDAGWRHGRAALLNDWLTRSCIYPAGLVTASALVARWDRRARANISAEAAALISGDE